MPRIVSRRDDGGGDVVIAAAANPRGISPFALVAFPQPRGATTALSRGADADFVNQPVLLQRVAAGERTAMEECLGRFGPLVWSAARRFLGNASEAEDVVQEIFIELWRKADRYEPALGSEVAFIMTLARRRLLDARRRSARRPEVAPLEDAPEVAVESMATVGPDDEAMRALAALRALPAEQQRVLELSLRDGFSHGEIAARLTMPLGTVKTLLRRGLGRLRQALEPEVTP